MSSRPQRSPDKQNEQPLQASLQSEGAQSIHRAVAVLQCLAASHDLGVRLSEVASACKLSPSTTHRILQALKTEGFAEKSPQTGRYLVGREALLLGMARSAPLPIRSIAEPYLREVCRQTGDSTVLTLRSGLYSINVDRITGSYPIQVLAVPIGSRLPLGVGVGGLAMLAYLPEHEFAQIIEKNLNRFKRYKLTLERLHQRIASVQTQRYAFTEAGVVPGTHVLAVPVFNKDKVPVAAISINAMSSRLSSKRIGQLVPILTTAATDLGKKL